MHAVYCYGFTKSCKNNFSAHVKFHIQIMESSHMGLNFFPRSPKTAIHTGHTPQSWSGPIIICCSLSQVSEYVNGTLYSLFTSPQLQQQARQMVRIIISISLVTKDSASVRDIKKCRTGW